MKTRKGLLVTGYKVTKLVGILVSKVVLKETVALIGTITEDAKTATVKIKNTIEDNKDKVVPTVKNKVIEGVTLVKGLTEKVEKKVDEMETVEKK